MKQAYFILSFFMLFSSKMGIKKAFVQPETLATNAGFDFAQLSFNEIITLNS